MEQKRMRSPGYPSMGLGEAIDLVRKMFGDVRTSAVDREVAAKAMGYSGITGRSGKVLSDLGQYALLEKAGKNEVRVTKVAVEILHPDSPETKARSVLEAAYSPELFQELKERFPDAVPSETALRSYLTKRGFTDAALNPAIRAYVETSQHAEQFREYDSHGHAAAGRAESPPDQRVVEAVMQTVPVQPSHLPRVPQTVVADEPQFNMVSRDRVILGGSVRSQADADRVIEFMKAMKALLPKDAEEDDA